MEDREINSHLDRKVFSLVSGTKGSIIATGTLAKCLNTFEMAQDASIPAVSEVLLITSLSTWHKRFVHVHTSAIKSMVINGTVKGTKLKYSNENDLCVVCVVGKWHRAPSLEKKDTGSTKIPVVSSIRCLGPVETLSFGSTSFCIIY